jgi:hypothetical protein
MSSGPGVEVVEGVERVRWNVVTFLVGRAGRGVRQELNDPGALRSVAGSNFRLPGVNNNAYKGLLEVRLAGMPIPVPTGPHKDVGHPLTAICKHS